MHACTLCRRRHARRSVSHGSPETNCPQNTRRCQPSRSPRLGPRLLVHVAESPRPRHTHATAAGEHRRERGRDSTVPFLSSSHSVDRKTSGARDERSASPGHRCRRSDGDSFRVKSSCLHVYRTTRDDGDGTDVRRTAYSLGRHPKSSRRTLVFFRLSCSRHS